MNLEQPTIEQARARGLIAGLDSFQQSHLNRLIAEYEEHFGQENLADLEALADKGDAKAGKKFMAIVDKLKEIVDFLATKEIGLGKVVKGKLQGNDEAVTCIDPMLKDYYGEVFTLPALSSNGKVLVSRFNGQVFELPEESVARLYNDKDEKMGIKTKIITSNNWSHDVIDLQKFMGVNVGDELQLTEEGKNNPNLLEVHNANKLKVIAFVLIDENHEDDEDDFDVYVALEFIVEDKSGAEPKMVEKVHLCKVLKVQKNFKKIN